MKQAENKPICNGVFASSFEGQSEKVIRADIKDVSEWMGCKEKELLLRPSLLPAEKFRVMVDEMIGTFDEFPEDKERTEVILKKIQSGEPCLPVFIEENDPHLFVMEGRHRMVAFMLAGIESIPVVFVSIKKPRHESHLEM